MMAVTAACQSYCKSARLRLVGDLLKRDLHGEAGLLGGRGHINRAAMRFGDLARDVEAETQALLARLYFSPSERMEQAFHLSDWNRLPRVADGKFKLVFAFCAHRDRFVRRSVRQRIAH